MMSETQKNSLKKQGGLASVKYSGFGGEVKELPGGFKPRVTDSNMPNMPLRIKGKGFGGDVKTLPKGGKPVTAGDTLKKF